MFFKLNEIFWRSKAVWLFAFVYWGCLNVPAIFKHWSGYETTTQAILGIVISLSFMIINVGMYYVFVLILNVALKTPILINPEREFAKIDGDKVFICRGGINSYIHLDAVKIFILHREYISVYAINCAFPDVILKKNIGDVEFNSMVESIKLSREKHQYSVREKSHIGLWVLILYVVCGWVVAYSLYSVYA